MSHTECGIKKMPFFAKNKNTNWPKHMKDCEDAPIQDKRVNAVMAWDLSRVKQYLMNRGGMKKARVAELEPEYKRFIALNILFPGESIPIAGDVDEMWHTHIMFTEDYERFSHSVNGGRFLHHRPTVNEEEAKKLLGDFNGNTLRLYEKVFGKPNMRIWHDCVCVCDG